jgi:hypothetical protein
MRSRVLLLGLSCVLFRPERSVAQHEPIQAPPPEASQFDFLVGEWTVDVRSKSAATPPQYEAVWRAWKTLNGLGIVDEYAVSDGAGRVVYGGTTLRVFDTKAGTWTMRYVDQLGGKTGGWAELVGAQEGPDMRVEQRRQAPDGRTTILKIRYYNIQPDHFSWAADQSSDGGATWVRDYLLLEARRRSKTASAP